MPAYFNWLSILKFKRVKFWISNAYKFASCVRKALQIYTHFKNKLLFQLKPNVLLKHLIEVDISVKRKFKLYFNWIWIQKLRKVMTLSFKFRFFFYKTDLHFNQHFVNLKLVTFSKLHKLLLLLYYVQTGIFINANLILCTIF